MNKVALIGYSGHSYVVADTIQAMGLSLAGYYESAPKENNPFNIKYLGDENEAQDLEVLLEGNYYFFVSIGSNKIRAKLMHMLLEKRLHSLVVKHPLSWVSPNALVSPGTLIAPGCKVNALATVGQGVILNTGAIVEHECVIGDYAHIAPGAILAGNVKVGEKAFIGANAVVKEGVTIGNNAMVGAGAVILKDIQDNEKWVGNPGTQLKNNAR